MSEVTHDPQQDYINSLEQQCAALTQRWSPEKPTKPGWYWWRDLDKKEGTATGMIVFVYLGIDGKSLCVQRDGSFGDIVMMPRMTGEWAGPLGVPQ